jgi:hypothetical protein
MKNTKLNLITLSIVAIIFGSSCTSKKPDTIPVEPSIKFVSMTPSTAKKNTDQVVITFEFIDGDGDLGENTPDVKNLFCTDSRNNVTYEFRIPQLAPDNAKIIIKGQQKFDLPPQGFVDDTHSTETTTYSIYIKDRAGNQSNTIQTSALVINN